MDRTNQSVSSNKYVLHLNLPSIVFLVVVLTLVSDALGVPLGTGPSLPIPTPPPPEIVIETL